MSRQFNLEQVNVYGTDDDKTTILIIINENYVRTY